MRRATDRPNILLINCDDLGYGDLGCYGSPVNRTPALDRLAADGVRCTDFCMGSPVCSPSRAAMLTGCYPQRLNISRVLFPGDAVGLNPREITIARLLQGQGYRTKIVGKWHCGDQPEFLPTRHGFESYYGIPYSNDMGRQVRKTPPTRVLPPLPLMRDEAVIEQQPDQAAITYRYVEECVRFLREHRNEPFFLYLAHMYVHVPIYAPEKFMRASRNGRYGAAVECIDWSTDVLVTELRRLGLAENTLVIFTSDNGSRNRDEGGSNAPLRGHKATTWEGGQRVPFILSWPGTLAPGRVCRELVTGMDVLPTLARLGGATVPDDRVIDGHDAWPALRGEPGASSRTDTFFYYMRDRLEAVRVGNWKLHVRKQAEAFQALYNLAEDIGEQHDVAAVNPAIVSELMTRIEAVRADLGDAVVEAPGNGRRPCGQCAAPQMLTTYDETYPYFMAEYDLADSG